MANLNRERTKATLRRRALFFSQKAASDERIDRRILIGQDDPARAVPPCHVMQDDIWKNVSACAM